MDYHFDLEHAKAYGVEEAIMLHNFIYWLRHNRANRKNLHEGRTWTYNTLEAFVELFPFWTVGQIRRILDSLISQGVIVKGNHNARAYDRTCWYSLADESLLELPAPICRNQQMDLPKPTNGFAETDGPIPDIKPDSKPDKKPERALPLTASLQEEEALKEKLAAIAIETLGAKTGYVDQAVKLVKDGEDPDEVARVWEFMLISKPEAAAFFARDYATRWKPKPRTSGKSSRREDPHNTCPICKRWEVNGHSLDCPNGKERTPEEPTKKVQCQSCGAEVVPASSSCPLCQDPIDGSLKRAATA